MKDLNEQLINDVTEQEERKSQALNLLLNEYREKKGHLIGLTSQMGLTRSYVTSSSLEWIGEHLRFANQLPIFNEKIDKKTGKIIIDRETLTLIQQRELDWRRQYPMTLYLAKRKQHKFPPMLVVSWQPWVGNPNANEWSNDKALKDSINAQGLDNESYYVDIEITDTDQLYVIDGQHRLMAIQGLSNLLNKGNGWTPRFSPLSMRQSP